MAWTVANFIAIAVVFPILAFASLGLRFWVRRITKASFGLDDALILPAAVSAPIPSKNLLNALSKRGLRWVCWV